MGIEEAFPFCTKLNSGWCVLWFVLKFVGRLELPFCAELNSNYQTTSLLFCCFILSVRKSLLLHLSTSRFIFQVLWLMLLEAVVCHLLGCERWHANYIKHCQFLIKLVSDNLLPFLSLRSISASHKPYKYITEHNQKVKPRKCSCLENRSAISARCICTVCDHPHKNART